MSTSAERGSPPSPGRRLALGAALAAAIGSLFRPGRQARAQNEAGQKASLLARPVERVPEDPEDAVWQQADLLHVPLAPQAVVKPRAYEAGVKAIAVRALYDADRLGLHLSWQDATRDTVIGDPAGFRDAVAVEFPADPAAGIPYFAMGELNRPVTIYHWKADWQFGRDRDESDRFPNMAADWYPYSGRGPGEIAEAGHYAESGGGRVFVTSWGAGNELADRELQAKTTVEKLEAEGFGTLTPLPRERQDGFGNAVWKDGGWRLVVAVPRAQERFAFRQGMTVPVAFAAWDGGKTERGGEKAVSTWYFLSLEQPIGTFALLSPALAFVGVAAVQAWGLRAVRRHARRPGAVEGAG